MNVLNVAHTVLMNIKETQSNFEEASKGTIASNFIKANEPFIPKSSVDVETYVKKLEQHYFDHVDFNNSFETKHEASQLSPSHAATKF